MGTEPLIHQRRPNSQTHRRSTHHAPWYNPSWNQPRRCRHDPAGPHPVLAQPPHPALLHSGRAGAPPQRNGPPQYPNPRMRTQQEPHREKRRALRREQGAALPGTAVSPAARGIPSQETQGSRPQQKPPDQTNSASRPAETSNIRTRTSPGSQSPTGHAPPDRRQPPGQQRHPHHPAPTALTAPAVSDHQPTPSPAPQTGSRPGPIPRPRRTTTPWTTDSPTPR